MKKIFLLLIAMIATTAVWAEDYITDVMVIGGSKSETNAMKASYTAQGWTVIDQDLNAGASGDYIFLLYKKASETASGDSFITDFYLSSVSGTAPDYLVHNGRTYHLAPCDGSDYFKSSKGDLNCHCSGSAYIHLYYTKEYLDNGQDYRIVKSISFNSTQAGALGENGGTTGYDLNAGAGGDYIYMHTDKSQGWTFTKNSDGTQCYINGFDGPKTTIGYIIIPTTLDGAQVANFVGPVFGGFTNLEEMIFNENTIISQMPSMQGCSSFKHVRTGSVNDQTPTSMTIILASAFAGTAIETINMPSITNIGEYAFTGTAIETINMPSVTNIGEHAFEESGLKQATLHSCLMEIGSYAFQNCNSLTDIYFDGTQQQWGNVTKGANWKPDATKEHWRCTVTFNVNGHGNAPEAQTIWSNQDKATEPAEPTDELCIFQGWFADAACTNQWDFNTVVTGDMTLYAKWKDKKYVFNSETGELKLLRGEYNKDNKWGDDIPTSAVKSVLANYGVSFTGDCSYLFSAFASCERMDLSNVNTSDVTNMSNMFLGCTWLTSLDISGWDTEHVTDMNRMFFDCLKLPSLNLLGWNTRNVTNMDYMFCNCMNLSTIYVNLRWNTENVDNSFKMFDDCIALVGNMGTTYDPNHIDKEYARIDGGPDCPGYFTPASYTFNSETGELKLNWGEFYGGLEWRNDVPAESVKSVTATSQVSFVGVCWQMFQSFSNCTSMDLSKVNTSNVTDMSFMFHNCRSLTSLDISGWDTGNVTNMSGMFAICTNLSMLDISNFNTSKVTNMKYMFSACNNLTTIYADAMWSTENVTNSDYMFNGCRSLVGGMGTTYSSSHIDKEYARIDGGPECPGYFSINYRYTFNSETGELKLNWGEFNKDNKWGDDVPAWAVTSVTATNEVSFTGDCSLLFQYFTNCTSMDLSKVNTSNVTNMGFMFDFCSSLTSLDLSGWDTGNVTYMSGMFENCECLSMLDLSGFNTSNVTDMYAMFSYCSLLSSINLSGWDTGNVTKMGYMFNNCKSLTSLDLSSWNTCNVTDMSGMFANCTNLSILDLSGFNTGNVTNMSYMFPNCNNLATIYAGAMWSTENVTNSSYMFTGCTSLVGGMGTTYNSSHINAEYARIDGGPECPGYFTDANPVVVPGDVNGDGAVTSADVTELYNYLLNGDQTYIATGDVNGDGTITSADITAVYSILLGN